MCSSQKKKTSYSQITDEFQLFNYIEIAKQSLQQKEKRTKILIEGKY